LHPAGGAFREGVVLDSSQKLHCENKIP
jgi:hypothetical protein